MDNLWILDIEASGLSPLSYPIEIGLVSGQHEYQSLIIPDGSWQHWNEKSENLHGISRESLYKSGKPAHLIANELNQLLGSSCVYSDHQDWDSFWMERLFATVAIKQQFSVEDIYTLMNADNASVFKTNLEHLSQASNLQRHRAINDARIINQACMLALSNN